jgi:hypothetical protein
LADLSFNHHIGPRLVALYEAAYSRNPEAAKDWLRKQGSNGKWKEWGSRHVPGEDRVENGIKTIYEIIHDERYCFSKNSVDSIKEDNGEPFLEFLPPEELDLIPKSSSDYPEPETQEDASIKQEQLELIQRALGRRVPLEDLGDLTEEELKTIINDPEINNYKNT